MVIKHSKHMTCLCLYVLQLMLVPWASKGQVTRDAFVVTLPGLELAQQDA